MDKAWRILCGTLAAALVIAHTLALVGGALNRLASGPEHNTIDRLTGGFLSLCGTLQRWNMFSPNVGSESYVPIIVIRYKDQSRRILSSPSTPAMASGDPLALARGMLTEEQRRMEWSGHFGDARRRKLDSRIADPVGGTREQGTTYTRWLLNEHLRRHPEERQRIATVDLYISPVTHFGADVLPRRGDVFYVNTYPSFDAHWPRGITTSAGDRAPPPRQPPTIAP